MLHSCPRYGGSYDDVPEGVTDKTNLLGKHAGHFNVTEDLVHEPVSHGVEIRECVTLVEKIKIVSM